MQCYQLPIACAELIIGPSKPGGKIEMQFNFVRVPCCNSCPLLAPIRRYSFFKELANAGAKNESGFYGFNT